MPDEEKDYLLAVVKESRRAYLAAWSALRYPVQSVINNSAAHRDLAAMEAATREKYEAAVISYRACRATET